MVELLLSTDIIYLRYILFTENLESSERDIHSTDYCWAFTQGLKRVSLPLRFYYEEVSIEM